MRNSCPAAPATVVMTAEELSSHVPLQVTIFGERRGLSAILRDTPPHVATPWRQAIDTIESRTSKTQPVQTFRDTSNGLSYTIWHHGRGVLAIVSGHLETLLPYTDTTENERESLLLAASHHATNGYEVLSIATIELKATATSPSEVTGCGLLAFTGCIALERTPNPHALSYARHAQLQGLRLLLISEQPQAYIETVGRRNGLLATPIKRFDAHELLDAPSSAQVVALRSATIIANISARTAPLVAGALSGVTAHLTSDAHRLLVL